MKQADWPDFGPARLSPLFAKTTCHFCPKIRPKKGFPIDESYLKRKSAHICILRDSTLRILCRRCCDFNPSPLDTTAAHGAHVLF